MKREFIMTKNFDSSWEDEGLSDDELLLLQIELMQKPTIGSVIRGTGGFRKARFALPGRGKSSGIRVIYLDIPTREIMYLMLAYPKSVKDTLSAADCAELKRIAESIKKNLREK